MDKQSAIDFAVQTFVILQPVLAAFGVAVLASVGQYIRTHTKNAYAQGVLVRASDLVGSLVKEANQTVVDDAKEAGTFDAATQAKVKADLVAKAKEHLGWKGLKELAKVLGLGADDGPGVTSWLSTKAEAAVHDLKVIRSAAEASRPPA